MTDDLVKRLRATCSCNIDNTPCLAEEECRVAQEAADRIQALEEERRKTFQALLRTTTIHDEVEVKLAKAVDALELADAALSGANMNMRVVEKKVKAAIAELKGGKDD